MTVRVTLTDAEPGACPTDAILRHGQQRLTHAIRAALAILTERDLPDDEARQLAAATLQQA